MTLGEALWHEYGAVLVVSARVNQLHRAKWARKRVFAKRGVWVEWQTARRLAESDPLELRAILASERRMGYIAWLQNQVRHG